MSYDFPCQRCRTQQRFIFPLGPMDNISQLADALLGIMPSCRVLKITLVSGPQQAYSISQAKA